MRHTHRKGIGFGVALFGALMGVGLAQAAEGEGLVSGGSGWLTRSGEASGETIKAQPLTGTAEKTPEAAAVKADATGGGLWATAPSGTAEQAKDNWLSMPAAVNKPVQNAAPSDSKWAASSNAKMPVSERVVPVGPGLKPVTPGYATTLDTPYFWDKPVQMASGTEVSGQASATQVARRRTGSGTTFVVGNGYANIGGYGPVNFPPYQYPYQGYNNNPFTGLSSYSNGYAGGPPSAVPFAGGLHQGRSAYWSQPTMVVPNVVYGVGNTGGFGGAYGTGYGGPAVSVSGGYRGGGGGGGGGGGNFGPRRPVNTTKGSNSNVNVNVNYQQVQTRGYGYGYY